MRRILLTICYDGTNYCGWQVQKNGLSVQSVVQDCLETVVGRIEKGICGCSRTDSGVHANKYCLHFDIENPIRCESIVNALNSRLPHDISVIEAVEVPGDFHARYSCKSKTYIYKIYNSKTRNPFREKYSLRLAKDIDLELLNKGCEAFVGTHDFKAFCSAHSAVKSTTRTIYRCSAERVGNDITITVKGDGFLYNMVRIIVGTLLYLNEGKITLQQLPEIIASGDRNSAGKTACAKGLFLDEIEY